MLDLNGEEIKLPKLIELSKFGGDWEKFIDAIYLVFKSDFVESRPIFRGQRLKLKKYPLVDGKEYTFYHFTHSGDNESERSPDLRRCERIGWPKVLIENCDSFGLKVWEQERRNEKRICIWLQFASDPDYIVILAERKGYLLPWTAFLLTENHEKRKKQREYEAYKKTGTANQS